MDTKVIKRGFLHKKGHVVKNWKTRLFVLESGADSLYYYRDEKEEALNKPLGAIPLHNARIIEDVSGEQPGQKRNFFFGIETVIDKAWIIATETGDEKTSWLEAIKRATQEAPVYFDLDAAKRNKEINKYLKETKKDLESEIKLLLLGPGDAGKSTIVKQMKLIHLNGYTREELIAQRPLIQYNLLLCIKSLVNGCGKLNIQIESRNLDIASYFVELQSTSTQLDDILPSKFQEIKQLWSDNGIQAAYERSREFQLPASCSYWMEQLERICSTSYVPTTNDILRCRVVTTGISETCFTVDTVPFRLVDVGGQRSERKKWIHCFQDVTAIIFCVAINEYDLKLVEDETVNRMHESVQLFDDMCNNKWLRKISMIVFLNKADLFREKISKVDMKVCFPDYKGGCNYEKAIEFIEDKLVRLNRNPNRPIYTHVTTATDTENVRFVFAAVKAIILQSILDDNQF